MRGIAVDKARGWVYVVDGEANRVNKYDLNGNFITRWDRWAPVPASSPTAAARSRSTTPAMSGWPICPTSACRSSARPASTSCVGPEPPQLPPPAASTPCAGPSPGRHGGRLGHLQPAHPDFSATGAFQKQWGARGPYLFNYARAIASNPVTNDWVITDTDNGRIVAYTRTAPTSGGRARPGPRRASSRTPGPAVANNGNIYVADSNNYRVQVLNSNGGLVTTFGTNAQFSYPKGIAIDPVDQSVWVADSAKAAITHWSASGAYLGKLAIGRGTADNQLGAHGIAIDKERVYVADVPTHKVKVWTKSGAFVTKISQRVRRG